MSRRGSEVTTVKGERNIGVGSLGGVRDGTGTALKDTLLIMRYQIVKLVNLQHLSRGVSDYLYDPPMTLDIRRDCTPRHCH